MTNYYQVQRSTSEIQDDGFAVLPFYLPKHGEINAFEFAGFKYKASGDDTTESEDDTKEIDTKSPTVPKGFRAYLFSCIKACQDYVAQKYTKTIDSPFLIRTFRGETLKYKDFVPANYSGNPGEYVVVGGPSIRDNEPEWGKDGIQYPATNCIHITYAHGDRPFYSEDGERFWTTEDGCYYLAVVEWGEKPADMDVVTGILYYR